MNSKLSVPVYPFITDYISHYAQKTPENEALVFNADRLSYSTFWGLVSQCAKALLASNVKKGDRVAMLCTTRLEYWVLFLASTHIGAVWMGLNPKYRLQEMQYLVSDAKPKLLFAMASFEQDHYGKNIAIVCEQYGFIEQLIALTGELSNSQSYKAFLALGNSVSDAALAEQHARVDTMDPALLVYTSGSTGKPKGALLSHHGLTFGSRVGSEHLDLEQPRTLCTFPINHVACVADTCCVNLVAGGTLVLQERFDPKSVLRAVSNEGLTLLSGVPTMLLMLLEHSDFEQTDFGSLELILWGGAAMPVDAIKRLQKLAPRLINVYGLTETAANTTYTSPEADLIELSETIGRPSPHMPCRIVDEMGKSCVEGEQGELQFKGDYLLLKYLNRPDATRDVYTEEGWLHTGDLAYWRDNGTITLVGRLSEMFKSGGYNVYPREVEDVLENHPSIDMAAVVSVPDSRFQEVGVAFVRVKPLGGVDSEDLRKFCKEQLANYKVPKHFHVVTELPILPVGKIDKVSLKKTALESLKEKR